MNVSVYIPIDIKYIEKIDLIISLYNNGSVIPYEIIVNVFGLVDEKPLNILRDLQKHGHENLKIYARKTHGTITENMNYASSLTSGDIILFHDCSRYPSLRRVDVISDYFKVHDVVGVHHTSYTSDIIDGVNLDKINSITSHEIYNKYFPFNDYSDTWRYCRHYGDDFIRGIDNKSLCVKREVLDAIKFKESYELEIYKGNDYIIGSIYEFSLETMYKYNKSNIVNVPLTIVQ